MPQQTMPPPSWVPGADACEGFGLNHLPYGAIKTGGHVELHARIGDFGFNLRAAVDSGLFANLSAPVLEACCQPILNSLLALGPSAWTSLRAALQEILSSNAAAEIRERARPCLQLLEGARLVLPLHIGDYTDFYASLHHARRVGELFRPDAPLLPNYKHVPIAYHGRASSIVVSGTPIRRPWGQTRPESAEGTPGFEPSVALDFEMELAFVVGVGNQLGEPIPIRKAESHLFGVTLLNDWSARDLQSWEYQPLGPFLGKSFATTLGAWITPLAALEAFCMPLESRPAGDPRPLPYLDSGESPKSFGVSVSATLIADGQPPIRLAEVSAAQLYWSPAQMVAHHTSNGCNLRPGDLLATGTISGRTIQDAGCLLERTLNGKNPLIMAPGIEWRWLQDGDAIRLDATCQSAGIATVRLGSCLGRIEPALSDHS